MSGKSTMKIGDKFHRLTVLELIKDKKHPRAVCLCECGNKTLSSRAQLRSGRAKSCGCLRREKLAAHSESMRQTDEQKLQSKENRRLWFKKWADANREKVRANNKLATRRFYRKNPDKVRANCQNRRARKAAAEGRLSAGIGERLFRLQRGKCACCKRPLGKDFHRDHRMPLALGGSNTDDNIQLLCAFCNRQKSAKHPIDFMQERGFLL